MQKHFVYHGSKTQGLNRLQPRISSHKKSYIYALPKFEWAGLFINHLGDFVCSLGVEDGKPLVAERFEGALDMVYKGKSGSIYTLPAETFAYREGLWKLEVVSETPVDVVKETFVGDAYLFLQKAEGKGMISIYRYPKLPVGLPRDKSDLVKKAIRWGKEFGESDNVLGQIEQYHPDILSRVMKELEKEGLRVLGN